MLNKIKVLLEMIKFKHTVFALPFAFMGAFLAGRGLPSLKVFIWVIVAMAGARTCAMGFNRIADRRFDAMNPPGGKFRYSCLGYITLAQIVQQISGQSIDAFTQEQIFVPLGMRHTRFQPPDVWKENIAATEIVDGQVLRGTVHDPLARLREGMSGNAGLFSTAGDVGIFCHMLLQEGRVKGKTILSKEAVALMTSTQSHGRAFGFDLDSSYAWIKGDHASEQAFCHSGYTGTSVVCDPASGVYVVILTNRAHPNDKGTVKAVRKGIVNIVYQAVQPLAGPGREDHDG